MTSCFGGGGEESISSRTTRSALEIASAVRGETGSVIRAVRPRFSVRACFVFSATVRRTEDLDPAAASSSQSAWTAASSASETLGRSGSPEVCSACSPASPFSLLCSITGSPGLGSARSLAGDEEAPSCFSGILTTNTIRERRVRKAAFSRDQIPRAPPAQESDSHFTERGFCDRDSSLRCLKKPHTCQATLSLRSQLALSSRTPLRPSTFGPLRRTSQETPSTGYW